MTRPMGLDIGNAAMNLVGPTPGNRFEIPHAVVDASTIERDPSMVPASAEPMANLHAKLTTPALIGTQTLIVGELATREHAKRVQEREEGEHKTNSPRHLQLALIGLAAASHRAWPVGQTVRLAVSVALPLSEVKNTSSRQALVNALKAEHTVEWLSTPGWAGRRTVMSIVDVDVVPEAAAAYLALANRDASLVQQRVMVADIGAGSIDWAVFLNGQFQLDLSNGTTDGGINVAADRIITAVHAKFGPHVGRHRADVLHALRAGAVDGTRRTWLAADVGRREITDIARDELDRLAAQIGRHVKEAVRAAGGVDRLLLVGGGGALIAEHLSRQSDMPFELADMAEWANAEGLYLRAADRVARGVVPS